MTTPYLDQPEQWSQVADHARKTRLIGFDTETVGHNVKESSPAFRARVHVWSIAFQTGKLSPRGYQIARGAVLPAAALSDANLRAVFEDKAVLKVAHNLHHDQHALENHGLHIAGLLDTLDLVRLAYPERALDKTKGFRLKPLARDLLGKPQRDEYSDIVNDVILDSKWVDKFRCVCGDPKCRKRKSPHDKVLEQEELVTSRKVLYELDEIMPAHGLCVGCQTSGYAGLHSHLQDHKQWTRLVEYAGADAIDALELADLAQRRIAALDSRLPPVPWEDHGAGPASPVSVGRA